VTTPAGWRPGIPQVLFARSPIGGIGPNGSTKDYWLPVLTKDSDRLRIEIVRDVEIPGSRKWRWAVRRRAEGGIYVSGFARTKVSAVAAADAMLHFIEMAHLEGLT